MTHEISSVLDALGLDADDLEWQDLAICDGQSVWRFYEGYETSPRIARQTDQMCLSCPVRRQCVQTGVENGEWGCWGGIYLTNGKMDPNKNTHKTADIWEQIREGIA